MARNSHSLNSSLIILSFHMGEGGGFSSGGESLLKRGISQGAPPSPLVTGICSDLRKWGKTWLGSGETPGLEVGGNLAWK